jgi:TonB family protein
MVMVLTLAIALFASLPQTTPSGAAQAPPQASVRGPKVGSPDLVKLGPGVTTPRLIKEVKPTYPESVKSARIEGMVKMNAVVLEDGTVGDVKVTTSVHPELDAEAVRTVRQWTFKPATRAGQAVPVAVEIEMQFALPKNS